jgi:hypothetical protein
VDIRASDAKEQQQKLLIEARQKLDAMAAIIGSDHFLVLGATNCYAAASVLK